MSKFLSETHLRGYVRKVIEEALSDEKSEHDRLLKSAIALITELFTAAVGHGYFSANNPSDLIRKIRKSKHFWVVQDDAKKEDLYIDYLPGMLTTLMRLEEYGDPKFKADFDTYTTKKDGLLMKYVRVPSKEFIQYIAKMLVADIEYIKRLERRTST